MCCQHQPSRRSGSCIVDRPIVSRTRSGFATGGTVVTVDRPTAQEEKVQRAPRARMTGTQRRHQLIEVARGLFAERGFEGTSIEEIAQRAGVSKPVVYE